MLWMVATRSRRHQMVLEWCALISAGKCWTVGAAITTTMGKFTSGHDLAVGKDGAVYVGDIRGQRVQKFVRE